MKGGVLMGKKTVPPEGCPRCGYVPERPHAAVCPRCRELLPGREGCSGCGACGRT